MTHTAKVKSTFRDFLIAHGYAPSRRELAACADLALPVVQEAVAALVATRELRQPRHGALALPEHEWRRLLDAPNGSLSRGWASGNAA